MRSLLSFFAVATIALGPIACAVDGSNASVENVSGEEQLSAAKRITDTDNGKTIDVAVGESFSIELSSNPSTGYSWAVQSVDRTLGAPKESFTSSDGAVGSGGVQRFTWSTKSALDIEGQHTIELAYRRPWESVPPVQTFSVTVNIGKGRDNGPLPPAFCSDGTIEQEPNYVPSSDGKECSIPRVHCVTKNPLACPLLSPLSPAFCKDGTVETEPNYIPSSDGKECSVPRVHCVTKRPLACPLRTPHDPASCTEGTVETEPHYLPSSDGLECSIPRVHCLTKNQNACPVF